MMDDPEDVPFTLGSIRIRNRSDHSIKSKPFTGSYRPSDVANPCPAEGLLVFGSSFTTCDVEGSKSNGEKQTNRSEEMLEKTEKADFIQNDESQVNDSIPSSSRKLDSVETLERTPVVSTAELNSLPVTKSHGSERIHVENEAFEDEKWHGEGRSTDTVTTVSNTTCADDSVEQMNGVPAGVASDDACDGEPTQPSKPIEPDTADIYESPPSVLESAQGCSIVEDTNEPSCRVAPKIEPYPSPALSSQSAFLGASSPVFQSSIATGPIDPAGSLQVKATGETYEQGKVSTFTTAIENERLGELQKFLSGPSITSGSKIEGNDGIVHISMHTRSDFIVPVCGDDNEVARLGVSQEGNVESKRRGRSRSKQRNAIRSRMSDKHLPVREEDEGSRDRPTTIVTSLPTKSSHAGTTSCDDTIASAASSRRMRERSQSRSRRRSRSHSRSTQRIEQTRPPVSRNSSRAYENLMEQNSRAETDNQDTNKMIIRDFDSLRTFTSSADQMPSREGLRNSRGVGRSRSTSYCSVNQSSSKSRSQSLKQQVVVEYDFDDGFDSFRDRQTELVLSSQSSVASARSRHFQRSTSLHQPSSAGFAPPPDESRRGVSRSASSDASVSSASCQRRRGVRRSSSLQPCNRRDPTPVRSSTTTGLLRSTSSSSLSGYIESARAVGASTVVDTTPARSSNCSITTAREQPRRTVRRSNSLQPSVYSARTGTIPPKHDQPFALGNLKRTPSVYAVSKRCTDQHDEDDNKSRKKGAEGLEISPFSQFPLQTSAGSASRQVPRKTRSLHVRRNGCRNETGVAPKKELKRTPSLQSLYQDVVDEAIIPNVEKTNVVTSKVLPCSSAPTNGIPPNLDGSTPSKKTASVADTSASSTFASEDDNSSTVVTTHNQMAAKNVLPAFKGSRLRCLIRRFKQ